MMDLFSSEQKVSSAPVVVNAHKNELVCLAINQSGNMMATASTKVKIRYLIFFENPFLTSQTKIIRVGLVNFVLVLLDFLRALIGLML